MPLQFTPGRAVDHFTRSKLPTVIDIIAFVAQSFIQQGRCAPGPKI
jgi:hypothetical protein